MAACCLNVTLCADACKPPLGPLGLGAFNMGFHDPSSRRPRAQTLTPETPTLDPESPWSLRVEYRISALGFRGFEVAPAIWEPENNWNGASADILLVLCIHASMRTFLNHLYDCSVTCLFVVYRRLCLCKIVRV